MPSLQTSNICNSNIYKNSLQLSPSQTEVQQSEIRWRRQLHNYATLGSEEETPLLDETHGSVEIAPLLDETSESDFSACCLINCMQLPTMYTVIAVENV